MMETVDNSGSLPKCCFSLSREWLSDQTSLLRALGKSIDLQKVKHADFFRGKFAVLTLDSWDAAQNFVQRGFEYADDHLKVRLYNQDLVTVKVPGCWYGLGDSALSSTLSGYCNILHGPDREYVDVDGVEVETDTRIYQCIVKKPVPPSFQIDLGKVRVWHRGQGILCYVYNQQGHIFQDMSFFAPNYQSTGRTIAFRGRGTNCNGT